MRNLMIRTHNAGIYQIVNTDNNRVYIGSATKFEKRWSQHINALRKNKHHNKFLQNDWNKSGESSFRFLVVELTTKAELIETEQKWIDCVFDKQNNCYNIRKNAYTLGNTFSYTPEETRKKMSDSAKKRPSMTQETKDKIAAAHTGRTFSEEYRAKLSASNMGVKRSAETRAKVSAAQKGKKMSTETRAKMSAAAKAAWLLRSSK